MKSKAALFFLFLWYTLGCCPAVLWAGRMEPSNFRFSASLSGEIKKGGYYRVFLPAEILAGCEKACKDIRVFDKENREIPFVILDNRIPAKKPVQYNLEVMSYDDRGSITKIVLKRHPPMEPVTRLDLETPDRDFNKVVRVSGSTDGRSWKRLGEGPIYDFSSRVNLRKTHIEIRKNTYRYFQLTIDEGQEKGNSQEIRLRYEGMDFSASSYTKKKLKLTRFVVFDDADTREKVFHDEARIRPSVSTDAEKRVTQVSFNTTLPFSTIEFAIDHPYYYRRIKLYGGKKGSKEDLVMIRDDSLYRFPISNQIETKKHTDLLTPVENLNYKIVIENAGNPPLDIESVTLKWVQKQLFFVGLEDDQPYRLCWGSPIIEETNYDISKLIRADNWFAEPAQSVQVCSMIQNTSYKPFGDRRVFVEKNVFLGIIVLVILVVGFFLFQLWKKTG